MSNQKFIDFIFIGPSKTASTWIYEFLKSHKGVSLPPFKESFFFDKFYTKGFDWYRSQFAKCNQQQVVGEFSHDYILKEHYLEDKPDAIKRIAEHLPEVKLICCLRNPYERTLSGYHFLKRNGYEYESLLEASSNHIELIEGSLYYKNLSHVLSYFARESLLILEFDELNSDPDAFAAKLLGFLNLSDAQDNELLSQKVNPKRSARNTTIAGYAKQTALLLRKIGLHSLLDKIKSNKMVNDLLFKSDTSEYNMSKEEFDFLSEKFSSDIASLSKLLGKDFKYWEKAVTISKY